MARLPLLAAALSAFALAFATGCASTGTGQGSDTSDLDTYSRGEIVEATSDFFGVTAEAAASVLERALAENGRPVGYIAGREVSGAAGVGLRYGEGVLRLKSGEEHTVFWQGPSVGIDAGANASRVFTLVYNLNDADRLYQRFAGVDGSAYFVAGLGVNYQRSDEITLAPIRSGVGLRGGANVGYLSYSRQRNWLPF